MSLEILLHEFRHIKCLKNKKNPLKKKLDSLLNSNFLLTSGFIDLSVKFAHFSLIDESQI